MKTYTTTPTTSLKFLSTLWQDDTSLRGRIALLSYNSKPSSKFFDQIILFVEYFQIMTLTLITNYKLYGVESSNKIQIWNVLSPICKVSGPGNLLCFHDSCLGSLFTVIVGLMLFALIRLLIFLYIVFLAVRKRKGSPIIISTWQIIFKLQARVIYFICASLWTNIYDYSFHSEIAISKSANLGITVVAVAMVIFEYSFTMVLKTQFVNVLPTKEYLASKNSFNELISLNQKFFLQAVRRALYFSKIANIWIFSLINLIMGTIRIVFIFKKLPFYNVKALFYNLVFSTSLMCLNITCIAQTIIHGNNIEMNFVVITWVILSFFAVNISASALRKQLFKILFKENKKLDPEALVHKIIIIKFLLKQNNLPTEASANYTFHYLLNSILSTRIQTILASEINHLHPTSFDLSSKSDRNKIFSNYLEQLLIEFPKNKFIRLYAAYRYAKKHKLYSLSIKTLADLKGSSSPKIIVSTCLLAHLIEKETEFDYNHNHYRLNLAEYTRSLHLLANLRLEMVEQVKLQRYMCIELSEPQPSLLKISNIGQKAALYQCQIQKYIKKALETLPDYYLEPYLLYGYYGLFLNYSKEEFDRYLEIYFKKSQKYEKDSKKHNITQENIFNKNNYLMILSGEKENNGIIVYNSENLKQFLGRDIVGRMGSDCRPPFMRPLSVNITKSLLTENGSKILNTENFALLYHVKGYLKPIYHYFNINPSTSKGLTYIAILRPFLSKQEFILLNEEGGIENSTEKIGKKLGLFDQEGCYLDHKINVSQISLDLSRLNRAINLTTFPEKFNQSIGEKSLTKTRRDSPFSKSSGGGDHFDMTLEEAKEIVAIYTTTGEAVRLDPIKTFSTKKKGAMSEINFFDGMIYNCTAKSLIVDGKVGKVLTLERVSESKPDLTAQSVKTNKKTPAQTLRNTKTIRNKQIESDEESSDSEMSRIDEQEPDQDPNDINEKAPANQWIDVEKLHSQRLFFQTTTKEFITSEFSPRNTLSSARNLLSLSPTSPERRLKKEPTFFPRETMRKMTQFSRPSKRSTESILNDVEGEFRTMGPHQLLRVYKPHWLTNSHLKISKLYEQTLQKSYHPFFYRVFLIYLYLAFLVTFVMQAVLSNGMENALSTLKISKDILRLAEARSNYIGILDGDVRFLWTYAMQASTVTNAVATSVIPIPYLLTITRQAAIDLEDTNQNLLTLTNSLNAKDREQLFLTDIRIYDVDDSNNLVSYINFTNFQATDSLVETALKAYNLAKQNRTGDALPYYRSLLHNLMNDVILKNREISNSFLAALETKKNENITSGSIFFALSMTLLAIITGGFIYILYIQGNMETNHLISLTKLSKSGTKHLIEEFQVFQNIIEFNINFDQDLNHLGLTFFSSEIHTQNTNNFNKNQSKAKQQETRGVQQPNSKGLWIVYYAFFLKLISLLLILVCLFSLSFGLSNKNLNSLATRANQIQFIEILNSRIAVTSGGFLQLISENGTTYVNNMLSPEAMSAIVGRVSKTSTFIAENFNISSEENPIVYEILYEEACKYIKDNPGFYAQCEKMANYQEKASLSNLFSNFALSATNMYSKFINSNRSSDTLNSLQIEAFSTITMPIYTVLQKLNKIVASALDDDFEKMTQDSNSQNTRFNSAILVILVLECFIIHFFIIRKIREKDNQFKSLLQLFPADLVLQNFILKSYLNKALNEKFNSFRE